MKKSLQLFLMTFMTIFIVACGNGEATDSSEAGAPPEGDNSDSYTIRVAHSSAATDDRLENSLLEFKSTVEEKSDGRLIIETYPNSQLGGEREILESVQMGSVEMAVLSTAPFAGFYDKMQILDLPYIFENEKISDLVLDGEFGDNLFEDMLTETGIRGLAWGENGIRHMATNDKAIETPDDVKGLKIRTQENPVHMDMIEEFGGSPTPIAFPELYSSLQQGVIDGYENPFSLIVGMRFYEVTDYITLTSHVNGVYAFIANDEAFTELPEDLQVILNEEATNWSDIERQMNREQEEEGRKTIEEAGTEIIELTDEQIDEFRKASAPVLEEHIGDIGQELYDELQEAIDNVQ